MQDERIIITLEIDDNKCYISEDNTSGVVFEVSNNKEVGEAIENYLYNYH